MSISFGSASKKPYVGSKEVKEAYVGSQLVYKSGPPIGYGFLGDKNDYFIADWCQLTYKAAIEKQGGIYRIAVSTDGSSPGIIKLTKVEGSKLSFICKAKYPNTKVYAFLYSSTQTSTRVDVSGLVNTANYSLCTVDVPSNIKFIEIKSLTSKTSGISCWIDAVRYEAE